jgi:hypothetical protein
MTTRVQRDWKVTTGYRMLLRVGWGVIVLAVYLAGAAAVLDSSTVWWIVAALAIGAMAVSAALPEPVPRDEITGRRTWVDPLHPR